MVRIHLLRGVCGADGKENDVLVSYSEDEPPIGMILFFPGDVMNTEDSMDVQHYQFWRFSYNQTADRLRLRFPFHTILIIRPKSIIANTFACYENFLPSMNPFGHWKEPESRNFFTASPHLTRLIDNISLKVYSQCGLRLVSSKIRLVGFSKGCTVLNQLVTECGMKRSDHFFLTHTVDDIVYIDSGNGVLRGFYPLLMTALREFVEICLERNIFIHIHVCPYTIGGERKEFARDEYEDFCDYLRSKHVKLRAHEYFMRHEADISDHFSVLEHFSFDRKMKF